MLRFLSEEKNYDQDQKATKNDMWSCKDFHEVPRVMHITFPSTFMVLRVVSSIEEVMPSFVLPKWPQSESQQVR